MLLTREPKYLQCIDDFIFERPSVNGLAAFAGSCWVSSLDHELLNVSVELRVVIVSRSAESEEILQSEEQVSERDRGPLDQPCSGAHSTLHVLGV